MWRRCAASSVFGTDVSPVAKPVRRGQGQRAQRLNDLERKNSTLKWLLADEKLEQDARSR
jgi:hypothetical protein